MLTLRVDKAPVPAKARSATEYSPWEEEVAPGIVQTKRNDLMIMFLYQGQDIDGLSQERIDSISDLTESALSQCDSRVTIWSSAIRRHNQDYPAGYFENDFAETIDQYWKDALKAGGQYSNTHCIAFCLASQQAGGGILDRVGVQLASGRGVGASIAFGLRTALSERAMEEAFISERDSDIQLLRDTAYGVLGGLPHIKAEELQGNRLRRILKLCATPASPEQDVRESRLAPLLDGYLPDNEIDFPVARQIRFMGTTEERYCGVLYIKDWVNGTVPGLLDSLMSLPMELTVSQTFKLTKQSKAEKYIESARAYNQQRMYKFKSVAMAKISRSPLTEDDADQGRMHNVAEANEALRVIQSERRVYGYYNLTVAIYAATAKELEDNLRIADEVIRSAGYISGRENTGLLTGWKSTLPGAHNEIVRWHFANTGHYADLLFGRTIAQGETRCEYFEEQTGRPAPALMMLPTEYSTPYSVSPLVGQVGHELVFGPNGGGKTVYTNFKVMQFLRYGKVMVFRFDKDYSAFVTTKLCNGTHVDLTSGDVKLCPWKLIKNPHHRTWLAQFTKSLLTSHGYTWKAEDDTTLQKALDGLSSFDEADISIETLESQLSTQWLRDELAPWLPGGSYGHLFGATEDNFSLSNHVCIEMGNLLLDPVVSPKLVDYFMYLIQDKLSMLAEPTPTLIDIQEASFFIEDPVFAPRLDQMLRTFRKRLAMVVMSMQSVQSATNSQIFASMGDNILRRVFLPNTQAATPEWREIYRNSLGLTDEQITRIAKAQPYRDYYLISKGVSRMLMFPAPPLVLAGLKSDRRALSVCRACLPADPAKQLEWAWKEEFVSRMVSQPTQGA